MEKEKQKITYADFMKQMDAAKEESGRGWYEPLEAEFAKPKSHKTH